MRCGKCLITNRFYPDTILVVARALLIGFARISNVTVTLRKLAEKKSLRNALITTYILLVLGFSATAKAEAVESFSKVGPVAQSKFLDPLPVPDMCTVAAPELVSVFCKAAE